MGILEGWLDCMTGPEIKGWRRLHKNLVKDWGFDKAPGSKSKHHNWEGGYRDHLEQCLLIAEELCDNLRLDGPLNLNSVFKVIYLHDIEKLWRYLGWQKEDGSWEILYKKKRLDLETKEDFYKRLFQQDLEKLSLSKEELTALKYIHGEGDDYGEKRVMNPLGAICHSADIISARVFYGVRKIGDVVAWERK